MVPPPWAEASSDEQYFVLLTGANSGVGLGTGQRLIDEFLASRPLSAHLILIPTTRSVSKSRDTVLALRAHLEKTAFESQALRDRAGPDYDPQTAISRVHVLSVQLDLCDLRSIYAAADQFLHGRVTDSRSAAAEVGVEVEGGFRIPRLDVALFNAGIGGWEGLDWLGLVNQFLHVGLLQSTTYPSFKKALPAVVLDRQKLLRLGDGTKSTRTTTPKTTPSPPDLAEVFCANVFGHYVLAHELLPLLTRASASEPPARIIWTSTIDATWEHLSFPDFQAKRETPPYESSKRITDLISLTADLPSVRKVSEPYFALNPSSLSSSSSGGGGGHDDDKSNDSREAAQQQQQHQQKATRPRFYVCHPGVVCTPLFPLNFVLYFFYYWVMYLSRWLGSPWHTVEPYESAAALSWLALAAPDHLDAVDAQHVKWGSACTRGGRSLVKKTEVPGWGWEGKVGEEKALVDGEKGLLSRSKGRKWDAETLTEQDRLRFEEDARECWVELEGLRAAWEKALGRR
ncbi:hypothetical protein F4778DRAFT_722043 [Xylariomycetidae sp. FL2044]|nr:hypothetical protein F4778DRAFT_722043 [Xylariomycetidae sp. FL2044]